MMVFKTSTNQVYFSGLWKYFVTWELPLPKGVTPVSIGASHDGFGVVDQNGRVFGWNGFVDTPKKYFDLNLSVLDKSVLGPRKVLSVGGKYENRFALVA